MRNAQKFYIDGKWESQEGRDSIAIVNPANGETIGLVAMGNQGDVDRAVKAARRAFEVNFGFDKKARLDILRSIEAEYSRRSDDLADAVVHEMGAPLSLAKNAHVPFGRGQLNATIDALDKFELLQRKDGWTLSLEPMGVAALITPWNWPLSQIALKVSAALAAGNAIVLKPSEYAPLSAQIFSEIVHRAGVPQGLFNMVHGDGAIVGSSLVQHEDVDVVSFTGSTAAGIAVARDAAPTVKRVLQELGGKSPNIILPDANLDVSVSTGIDRCFRNSGQTCIAPTRMLVHESQYDAVKDIAARAVKLIKVGEPCAADTILGPLANRKQQQRVEQFIHKGIEEGAELIAGGLGVPEGCGNGFFVRPTVFGRVTESMTIAQEEIFGPVLSIMTYKTEDDAIRIANNTPYGLGAYVQSGNRDAAYRVASKLRAGKVEINYAAPVPGIPFGGMRKSGNGREGGEFGIHDFLEIKAICE